ncbi:ribosome maturation factor RimM [Candidatus Spongiisocius sp.]|uniref:ribosome maturation factor RimM n=1 Tax=Candidatus Spongiisocius sp. TaxID=3101273 RepID=UPI003B5B9DD2
MAVGTPPTRDAGQTGGDPVVVGRIVSLHGKDGAVRVRVESDHPQRFIPPARFRTGLPDVPLLVLRSVRAPSGDPIAEFAGITSAEQAARLVGADLLIKEGERRDLEPGEYWPDQLIGLVVRVGSDTVGVVEDLIEAPQDRLAVRCGDGALAEVPFVEPLVPEIDLAGGWIRLDPPEGLLGG